MIGLATSFLRHVIVYKGHVSNPVLGPYFANIEKRIKMFNTLNDYRKEMHRPEWKVSAVEGEQLAGTLEKVNPEETLLVIPAGQSTNLDRVFSEGQLEGVRGFFERGGRGYFNCGSAYWVSKRRVYRDLCSEQPENAGVIVKSSHLPLFEGTAEGPLCPYPGKKYRVGFFSDAVEVTDGKEACTIYLSGGGSFQLGEVKQKTRVLVKYSPEELIRHGKREDKWQNAVIMVSVGKGAAMLSMFHPYYGPQDIDVDTYEKQFPQAECGTNWQKVKERLSPLDDRMRFVLKSILNPLEDLAWEEE